MAVTVSEIMADTPITARPACTSRVPCWFFPYRAAIGTTPVQRIPLKAFEQQHRRKDHSRGEQKQGRHERDLQDAGGSGACG
jgi:hypothetical protein